HSPIDTLDIDNHKVREGQIARIRKAREARDEAACQAALRALTEAARQAPPLQGEGDHAQHGGGVSPSAEGDTPPSGADAPATSPSRGGSNLLALAVECARQNATLGEISAAMEEAFGRYDTVPTPVKGIYSAAYADDARYGQVIEGVKAVERRLGRAPKIMVAKMGQDGH